MSEWSHLPNAKHIDRVLQSANQYPDIWREIWFAARSSIPDTTWNVAWSEAWLAMIGAGVTQIVKHVCNNDHEMLGKGLARSSLLTLITYDDCEQYLSMTSEELRLWSLLSNNPAAILLLPAVIAFERIAELERAETV